MSEDFTVTWAPPSQTAAVLTLLPELLAVPALPPRFAVAHAVGSPSRLLGAAAFVPAMRHAPSPGFRGIARVLEPWRRRGIGRALLALLGTEVLAWDVPHMLAWQAESEGAASQFMRALGFRIDYTLHHFLIDKTVVLPMCARLVRRLRERGRVPAGYALLALDRIPRQALIELHAREFNAGFEATEIMLKRELADPAVRELSFALWNGTDLAGYLLAGFGSDLPEVRFWASDPARRGGWAAALLLEAFVRSVTDRGWDSARYQCNANARAPLNVARKAGARELELTNGWVLDLSGNGRPGDGT